MESLLSSTPPPDIKPPCVLVIEDELGLRELYEKLFVARNVRFEWEFATTVDEALGLLSNAQASETMYSLVVTDLMLGDLERTGLTIVKWMREQGINCHVITLSGYDEIPLTLPQKLLEIAYTLEKPLGVPKLVGCIEELLFHHGT
jgi:DNA-binding NtrC family response regulator